MTVSELIEALKVMPQNKEVIFRQDDPEGCFWLGPDLRIPIVRSAQEKEGEE